MASLFADSRFVVFGESSLFRRGLYYILKSHASERIVTEIDNFSALFAYCRQGLPDVLLLEMQLPGEEVQEMIRALLSEFPGLKIIVLSIASVDKFILQTMKVGVRGYLSKDTDEKQLLQAVEDVLTTGYHFTPRVSLALLRGIQLPANETSAMTLELLHLTPREKEVLRLICESRTAAEIADQLFISRRTVEGHWQRLLEKTNATNSVGLVVFAARHGLLNG